MSDQTKAQVQDQPLPENQNLTSPENREPDPPCCTVPPPDPGPST
jgi:hypothetical protein